MISHGHDMCFRVLAYKEDGEFVAHALEADLLGYGATMEEAMQELNEALEAQISFAIQMEDLSLIEKAAPKELFEKFEEVHRQKLLKDFRQAFTAKAKKAQRKASAPSRSTDARFFGFSTDDILNLGTNRLEPYLAKA